MGGLYTIIWKEFKRGWAMEVEGNDGWKGV